MQQYTVQQEQHTCILHEDKQQFIEEISVLRSLAEVAGVAANLLAELEVFKHEVEHLDSSAWEQNEVRVLKRHEFVCLCIAVLRAFNARSCDASCTD
jgi:hypothetical protein